jgi:uncharacterized protein
VADRTRPVTIGFLGGEPFAARQLIHQTVAYATKAADFLGQPTAFSITTNGTLLQDEDVQLLRSHPFAVTVSVDGGQEVHDEQRPLASGSSFARLRERIRPLLDDPGRAQISARATVQAGNLNVRAHFAAIAALGFADIGFSPLRPPAAGGLRGADWKVYLSHLRALAEDEIVRVVSGGAMRLTNLMTALRHAHRGFCMPYSCGAGGSYFSVSATGSWYACHRTIGSAEYELGDSGGIDLDRRRAFLAQRHVHAQTECQQCWARYLCSGGCHQEAGDRNPDACGFIRGWLETCLAGMCEIQTWKPDWFDSLTASEATTHA